MKYSHKRILIVGDSGRGKSTFAEKLSRLTGIPSCSTDDFYYIRKFDIVNDKQKSIEQIAEVYAKDSWIVDGTTRHLQIGGVDKADVVYLFEFNSIIPQYYYIIKRSLGRKHESWRSLFNQLKHITLKRYKRGYKSHVVPLNEFLLPHMHKVVRLNSMRKINNTIKEIERLCL